MNDSLQASALDRFRRVAATGQGARVYAGNARIPTVDAAEIRRLHREQKLRPTKMAKRVNIARASVYRALGKREAEESA